MTSLPRQQNKSDSLTKPGAQAAPSSLRRQEARGRVPNDGRRICDSAWTWPIRTVSLALVSNDSIHGYDPVRRSQWVISSEARVSYFGDRPDVVISTLATGLERPFDEDALLAVDVPSLELSAAGVEILTLTLHERLGVEMQLRYLAVGGDRFQEIRGEIDTTELDEVLRGIGLTGGMQLAEAVYALRVPTLGSPPEGWKGLGSILTGSNGAFAIFAGFDATTGRPILAVLTGATGFVVWFAAPYVQTVRDHFNGLLRSYLQKNFPVDATPKKQARKKNEKAAE